MSEKEKKIPIINRNWCKECGICVNFCLRNALAMNETNKAYLVYPQECNSCGLCELRCPDLAIEVK